MMLLTHLLARRLDRRSSVDGLAILAACSLPAPSVVGSTLIDPITVPGAQAVILIDWSPAGSGADDIASTRPRTTDPSNNSGPTRIVGSWPGAGEGQVPTTHTRIRVAAGTSIS